MEKRSIRLALSAISAVILAIMVMFPVLGALEWFALVPFSLVLFYGLDKEETWRRRFADLLVFFGVYFLMIYHWFFYMYPMEFLGIGNAAAAVVVVVAWLGLAALVAVPAAFLFLLWKPLASKMKGWMTPFLAASLWVILEWMTTLTFAGVPWSRLALGQTRMLAVIQTTSLFGSYFIAFLIVSVSFCLGYVLFYRKRLFLAVPIVMFALNLIVGAVMLANYEAETSSSVKIAAVQGNTPSAEKWDTDGFFDSLDRHYEMTVDAGKEGADIIVWSESVVPDVLSSMPFVEDYIAKSVKESNSLLVFGAFDCGEDGKQYNALFLMDRDGTLTDERYYKQHLVPFGEYIPFRRFVEVVIPPLANINVLGEDLFPGEGSMLIESEYGSLGSLICFDSIYEELARKSVRDGAEIILLSTNDSWFGDSAALYMHNAQAVLRAVENRRFVVRAANTGISSMISPTGEVLATLMEGETGYLLEEVYMHSDITFYTMVGNVFVALCGLYLAILLGLSFKKKKAA